MNALWHRVLKPLYRKEPISSFVLTVGAVDVAIGGLGSYGSLLLLGTGTVATAIALRWWQIQRAERDRPQEAVAEYCLPPSHEDVPLPRLKSTARRRR